jgi:hypothetical protein
LFFLVNGGKGRKLQRLGSETLRLVGHRAAVLSFVQSLPSSLLSSSLM